MSLELFELKCSVLGRFARSLMIRRPDEAEVSFVPLSQVRSIKRNTVGYDTVHVSAWLAKQRGWR